MTQYQLIPQPGYMTVEPISEDQFNVTELATLENDREHIATGKVLSVSKFAGTYENYGFQFPTEVKEGDVIAYVKYSEHPVKLNGAEIHVVAFNKVIGVIEESK